MSKVLSFATKTIEMRCTCCGQPILVEVTRTDYERFKKGEKLSNVHYLLPEERELFISGTCGFCWDDMFREDEDMFEDAEDEAAVTITDIDTDNEETIKEILKALFGLEE